MIQLPEYLNNPLILLILFLFSAFSTAFLTPLVIRLALKIGAIDRGGYRRIHRCDVPLIGGLGIAIPIILFFFSFGFAGSLIAGHWRLIYQINRSWIDPLLSFAADRNKFSHSFITLAIGGIAILTLGFIDDVRGMRARVKLIGQIVIAVYICASGYFLQSMYIPLIGAVEFSPAVGIMISIIWTVSLINAFNLIDGLDGLATGIALIASITLAVLGAITGNVFVVLACTALAGSLAAFLVFNFYPARIFLGDTGSMFIGYVLAVVTLMGTHRSETALIILAPMLALSFPIFETLISMIRRYIRGVPIFAGDHYHTHHRLLGKGFSNRQVVLILYAVTLLLAGASCLSQIISKDSRWNWFPGFIFTGSLIGIAWWAGYFRRETLKRIFLRHRRNTILSSFSRYAIQSLSSKSAFISPFEILGICRRELRLRFLEAWFEDVQTLIGSSGRPSRNRPGEEEFDPIERLRIQSVNGMDIIIRYQFSHEPDENELQDALACLAHIFEQAATNSLLAKVIKKQSEIKTASSLRVARPEFFIDEYQNHSSN